MGRRQLARPLASAAACLALAVLVIAFVAAAVHGAGVPSSSAGIGRGRAAVATSAAFDAARCKEQSQRKGAGAETLAGLDDDDDKRVVPTGPNPLHNR